MTFVLLNKCSIRINKQIRLIIFIFTSIFFSHFSYSQNLDSLYLQKLHEYTDKNNDSILFYASKLKSSQNPCSRFRAINYESKAIYQMGNIEESEAKSTYVLEELDGEDEYCLKLEKLAALNRLFWIYKNQRLYQKAFDIAVQRKEIIELLPRNAQYNVQMRSVKQNMAIIKNTMGLFEEAREIWKENLEVLPSNYTLLIEEEYYKDKSIADYFLTLNKSSILNQIGESFLNSSTSYQAKELDSASYYFKKAYEVAQNFDPPHEDTETLYKLREADVLIAKRKFRQALDIVNTYCKNSEKYNTSQRINTLKAICYNNLKVSDSAIFYSRSFIKRYEKEKTYKEKLITIYDILSNQYFNQKQFDSAYKYSELTITELNEFNKNKTLVNKAHYLRNDRDIRALNNSILKKENSKQNILITGVIVSIFLLIWFRVYYKSKNKKIENELAVTKQTIGKKPEKKDYNITPEIEENILRGLAEFEKNKGFLDADCSVKDLAEQLNTNTTYLSFVFNKNYDYSFKNYITNLRMDYIVNELKENPTLRSYTVKAIGEEIGYSNASAFSRAFKKHQGVTPSEFIKTLT